jgi:membrane protease YdiL (CAAX protease family)
VIANLFIDEDGRLRSGWRFLLALVTLFAAFFISEIIAGEVTTNVAIRNVISRPIAALIMLSVFWMLAKGLDHAPKPSDYIGLGIDRAWPIHLIMGCVVGAALVSISIGVIAAIGSYRVESAPALSVNRWTAAGVVAWIFFFGALAEELGFRSYPFQRLIECLGNLASLFPSPAIKTKSGAIGAWAAILLLAGLFGSVHLANPNATFFGFANTVLIGVFFGLLMVRTGSLWLLWGVHFGWNFSLGALFGLPVSGINQFSVLWTGRAEGPTWLTGGAYGIEASATVSVLILLAILALAWLPKGPSLSSPDGIQPE